MADVHIINDGSIFIFDLLSGSAREWVAEHVSDDAQYFGEHRLVVEHRYAIDLASGMVEAGLEVE